jgi:hypothetical protein
MPGAGVLNAPNGLTKRGEAWQLGTNVEEAGSIAKLNAMAAVKDARFIAG